MQLLVKAFAEGAHPREASGAGGGHYQPGEFVPKGESGGGGQDTLAAKFGMKVELPTAAEPGAVPFHLEHAARGFADLGAVLGLSPQEVGLSGGLTLRLGDNMSEADRKAEFSPEDRSLTIGLRHGAGNLGHEWWHALDNALARHRFPGKGDDWYLSENLPEGPLGDAMEGVLDSIHGSLFGEYAKSLDAGKKEPYWSLDSELTARAFEAYLEHRLTAEGRDNPYLVNTAAEGEETQAQNYPTEDDDTGPIFAAFDRLLSVVRDGHRDLLKGIMSLPLLVPLAKGRLGRKPAPGQGSLDFDAEEHPRAAAGGRDGKYKPGEFVPKGETGGQEQKEESPVKPDRASVIRSAAFKGWFGDSKIVKEDGSPQESYPLKVLHGTRSEFRQFDPAKLGNSTNHPTSRLGFFFTPSLDIAKRFAGYRMQRKRAEELDDIARRLYGEPLHRITDGLKRQHVGRLFDAQPLESHDQEPAHAHYFVECYLSIQNPYVMPWDEWNERFLQPIMRGGDSHGRRIVDEFRAKLESEGHDGMILQKKPGLDDSTNEYSEDAYIAFRPEQIKATGNAGTFDPTSPDIYKALRGVKPAPGQLGLDFDAEEHPRAPAGSHQGGQFVSKESAQAGGNMREPLEHPGPSNMQDGHTVFDVPTNAGKTSVRLFWEGDTPRIALYRSGVEVQHSAGLGSANVSQQGRTHRLGSNPALPLTRHEALHLTAVVKEFARQHGAVLPIGKFPAFDREVEEKRLRLNEMVKTLTELDSRVRDETEHLRQMGWYDKSNEYWETNLPDIKAAKAVVDAFKAANPDLVAYLAQEEMATRIPLTKSVFKRRERDYIEELKKALWEGA